MVLRFGVLLVMTGVAFLAMGWLEPAGPLLIILGATCWATALEAALDLMDPERVRVPLAAEVPLATDVVDEETGKPRAA
jgi:hypothetical protein